MHLVGFVIRIYHDARSPERQTASPTCHYFIFVNSCLYEHPNVSQESVQLPQLKWCCYII